MFRLPKNDDTLCQKKPIAFAPIMQPRFKSGCYSDTQHAKWRAAGYKRQREEASAALSCPGGGQSHAEKRPCLEVGQGWGQVQATSADTSHAPLSPADFALLGGGAGTSSSSSSTAPAAAFHRRFAALAVVDLDAFYAQVEMEAMRREGWRPDPPPLPQQGMPPPCTDPAEFPVAVSQKNIVVTCNYPARARGVGKLMRIEEALLRCPELVLRCGEDLTSYAAASDRFYCAVRGALARKECELRAALAIAEDAEGSSGGGSSSNCCCGVERAGMDELFIDMGPLVQLRARLQLLARARGAAAGADVGRWNWGKTHQFWQGPGERPPAEGELIPLAVLQALAEESEIGEVQEQEHDFGEEEAEEEDDEEEEEEEEEEEGGEEEEDARSCSKSVVRCSGLPAAAVEQSPLLPHGVVLATARLMLASEFVSEVRHAVRTELGFSSCAGIGHNRMSSKFAADMHKPDAQTCFGPSLENLGRYILPLPLSRFPGIGRATARRLLAGGVSTGADLCAMPLARLVAGTEAGGFGLTQRTALFLFKTCRGTDDAAVDASRGYGGGAGGGGSGVGVGGAKSVSCEDSFSPTLCATMVHAEAYLRAIASALRAKLCADCVRHSRWEGKGRGPPRKLLIKWRPGRDEGGKGSRARTKLVDMPRSAVIALRELAALGSNNGDSQGEVAARGAAQNRADRALSAAAIAGLRAVLMPTAGQDGRGGADAAAAKQRLYLSLLGVGATGFELPGGAAGGGSGVTGCGDYSLDRFFGVGTAASPVAPLATAQRHEAAVIAVAPVVGGTGGANSAQQSSGQSWQCVVCTFLHRSAMQQGFLACAVCSAPRKAIAAVAPSTAAVGKNSSAVAPITSATGASSKLLLQNKRRPTLEAFFFGRGAERGKRV
jgi:nucleotidyltransferase/DNA polymerase involved in DNA repair